MIRTRKLISKMELVDLMPGFSLRRDVVQGSHLLSSVLAETVWMVNLKKNMASVLSRVYVIHADYMLKTWSEISGEN